GELPDYSGNRDNLLSTQQPLKPGVADGHHNDHFWSHHGDSCNFAMADGSVRPISCSIGPTVLQALSTRDRGDLVDF
ncbi:MAG: DUF1559 domain-containing protein, partial [Planctomycetaceae bacterium]|nr:DUF1559 domain-containing protein [Planctomycetaceae bacterium]